MKKVFKFVYIEIIKILCICACLVVFFPLGVYLASRLTFVEVVLLRDRQQDLRSCFALSWALSKHDKQKIFFGYLCLFVSGIVCLSGLLALGVVFKQAEILSFAKTVALLFATNVVLVVLFVSKPMSFATKNFEKAQQTLLAMPRE